MDDAVVVRNLQPGSDAPPEFGRLFHAERPPCDNVRKRAALDKLHGQVGPVDDPVRSENVIAHDAFVLQPVECGCLAVKQRHDRFIARKLGLDHFQRDRITGGDLVSAIDLAHAALGDLLANLVQVIEPRTWRNAGAGLTSKLNDCLVHRLKPVSARWSLRQERNWLFRLGDSE